MVDKELTEISEEIKYKWINDRNPNRYDIYWVIIKNTKYNTYESTICNYICDPEEGYWDCLEDEEVLCWMPFENFIPKIPITLMEG